MFTNMKSVLSVAIMLWYCLRCAGGAPVSNRPPGWSNQHLWER
jgi:hypothetical protein